MCSQCRGVYYCSKACQLAHWPSHKASCRRGKRQHVEAEATSLASPLGDSFHVESAIEFRKVIHATIPKFLSLATLPFGSKQGDTVFMWISLTFDPTATDVSKRWKPRSHRSFTVEEFHERISCLPEHYYQNLLGYMKESLETIERIDHPIASPWVVTIFAFEDTPFKGNKEFFMSLFEIPQKAPCAGVDVDWVEST
ncbi:hypothetical protein RQP46_009922 [Phenoliferia psychrophenolica]